MLEIFVSLSVILLGIAFRTVAVAVALWLSANDWNNPFKEDGRGVTWGKCAGLSLVAAVIGYIGSITGLGLVFLLVGIVVWIGGILVLFQRTFMQSLLLAILIACVSYLMALVLGMVVVAVLTDS